MQIWLGLLFIIGVLALANGMFGYFQPGNKNEEKEIQRWIFSGFILMMASASFLIISYAT